MEFYGVDLAGIVVHKVVVAFNHVDFRAQLTHHDSLGLVAAFND